MTVVLSELIVCDGYDVRVLFNDGRQHVFHFLEKPAFVQARVEELEQQVLAVVSLDPPAPPQPQDEEQ
jgi:hypothetical protein